MRKVSIILLLFCSIEAHTQISLLKDVNSLSSTNGSNPDFIVGIGTTAYFTADDGVHGTELWKKDANGVSIVKDIYVGSGSSAPYDILVIGTTLYFRAASAEGGSELWKSDGTTNGTVQVKDIFPGVTGSEGNGIYTTFLTNVNGVLFFAADDGTNGLELWKSDGSANGTVMVKDINPAGDGVSYVIGYSATTPFVNVNGTLFFTGDDGTNGAELWKSNGTAAGTVLVKSISPTGNSDPSYLTNVNGTLFFTAEDAPNSNKLYKSNGTSAGTIPLITIPDIPSYANAVHFINGNGTLYFDMNDGGGNGSELWKSDGTVAGTVRVKDIYAGANSSYPNDFVWYKNLIYFAAGDATGTELWKSDGTAAGTVKVKDINPTDHSLIRNLTVSGGLIYFGATEGVNGFELWKSDGTAGGTVLAMDINPAGSSMSASDKYIPMADVGGQFYFAADDGSGRELWQSNGTTVSMVVDLLSGSNDSAPYGFTYVNTTLFFAATDGINGRELWKSNGTTAGTVMVKNINATGDSYAGSLTEMNGVLYFSANDGTSEGLWKSDGTSGGTVLIKSVSGYFNELINANGTLYFTVNTEDGLYQIWKSNGTAAGTVMIEETDQYYSYHDLRFVNGNLYFINFSNDLWKTNGSVGGATLVKTLTPLDGYEGVSLITGINNTLYFRGHDGGAGSELWKSNGTPAGTTIVKDINPAGGSYPSGFSKFGTGVVFWTSFAANDYELGYPTAIWKSDGTSAGTTLVKNVTDDSYYYSAGQLFEFGSSFYFSASAGAEGAELWKSDGTPAGTAILNDINPGGGSSNPGNFVTVGGKLFFTAYDGVNRAIWVTDGQSCHTQKVASFDESESADPIYLYVAGSKIYFSMNVKGYGVEPFVLDPASITFPPVTSITTQPTSKAAYLTNSVSFTVVADGGDLKYQWKKGGVNINGAMSPTYTINSVTAGDAGTYSVEVKGTCGTVLSSNAILTVFAADPGQPSAITFSNPAPTSYTIKWTAPAQAPTGYLVVRRTGSSPSGGAATDGTTYAVGNAVGNGTVAFITSAPTFDYTGLTAATNYYYDVYSYNGTGTSINYALTPLEGNRTTLSLDPTAQPSGLSFSTIKETTLTLTFLAAATGPTSGYLVLRKTGINPPSFVPVDGTVYSASSSMDDATFVASGTSLSISETGLTAGTEYAYAIYTYNGSAQSINYNATISGNTGATITVPNAPALSTDPIEKNSISFTAKWISSPGATSYRLDVSLSADNFTEFVVDFEDRNVGNVIEAVVSGLAPATVYKFRVRATNASGPSQNSVEKEVVTAENPATALNADVTIGTNTISVDPREGKPPYTVKVYYKGITAEASAPYQEKTLAANGGEIFAGDFSSSFDELGVKFYVKVTDSGSGLSIKRPGDKLYVLYRTYADAAFTVPLPHVGGKTKDYNLFAIPLDLSNSNIQNVFEDEMGAYDKTKWRLLRWENDTRGYVEYKAGLNEILRGRGYWFASKSQPDPAVRTGIGITGDVTKPAADTIFTMSLTKGWNQIGNPFPFDFEWQDVLDHNNLNDGTVGDIYRYDANFLPTTTLKKNEGAFVHTENAVDQVNIPATIKSGFGGRKSASPWIIDERQIDGKKWLVPFTIRQGDVVNSLGGFGMHPRASISKDGFDRVTLPRFGDFLEADYHHPEYFYPHFTRDVVTLQSTYTWSMVVSSAAEGEVAQIEWDAAAMGTNDVQLFLYDPQVGIRVNMKEVSSYRFINTGGYQLSFHYSSEGVELVPDRIVIGKAYPNPFDERVHIPFTLSEEYATYNVNVTVVDMLGREVGTIASGQYNPGFYEATWDGADDSGHRVTPGIYIVRFTIPNISGQNVRVLLKN